MARTIKWQRTGGKTQRVTVTEDVVVPYEAWAASQYRGSLDTHMWLAAQQSACSRHVGLGAQQSTAFDAPASCALSWLGF